MTELSKWVVLEKEKLQGWAEALLYGDTDDSETVITELWIAACLDLEDRWK